MKVLITKKLDVESTEKIIQNDKSSFLIMHTERFLNFLSLIILVVLTLSVDQKKIRFFFFTYLGTG